MGITVRMATADDIDAIARLTAAGRRRLAGWAPRWWAPAEGADDLHPLWLRHLVEADGPVVRVADDGGTVVGCAVSLPQPGQWAVDDLQVADGRWPDAGAALLAAVAERPALHCAASADADRLAACAASGLTAVSRYWIGPPTPAGHTPAGHTPAGPSPAGPTALPAPVPLAGGTPVPPGPPHTFGAALDPHAPGAVALTDGAGGVVVASPPSPAPPVYDPDGTVTVIDRLTGDRPRLLDAALAAVAARGDVLVALVAAPDDDGLATLLADRGLSPTVDVLAWPLTRVPTA